MAKYSGTFGPVTLSTAYANTVNLTNSTYPFFLQGLSAGQVKISEVYMGGEAQSASNVAIMVLGRDSTVAASSISGITAVLTDGTATAPGTTPAIGNSATTAPQRSANHLLHLSFNTYGGIVRWVASPDQTLSVYGTGTTNGEVSLSPFTGTQTGSALSGHVLYEVV